jgi:ribonuclease HII
MCRLPAPRGPSPPARSAPTQRCRRYKLCAFDREFEAQGFRVIAGVDEAGRGALAVRWSRRRLSSRRFPPPRQRFKTIDEDEREALFDEIVASAISVGISFSQPAAIDRYNILQATLMSMHRAVDALRCQPDIVLVDGRELFQWPGRLVPVIKGDAKSLRVAAASILAKVARDRLMRRLHRCIPSTTSTRTRIWHREHWDAINAHGMADVHRVVHREIRCKRTVDVLKLRQLGGDVWENWVGWEASVSMRQTGQWARK